MSKYIDNCAGASITEGLNDYLIFGSVDNYSPITSSLVDGNTYPYKAIFSDGETVGYETGVGTWNAVASTLSRDDIKTSSNSDGKVAWDAGTKTIYIVADTALLTDMEQMVEGATKKILTVSERSQIAANTLKNAYPPADAAKVALITVASPVNLDQLAMEVDALSGGMVYQGDWNAGSGVFPGSGIAQQGWMYYVSGAGTVDGVSFDIGDNLIALKNNASTSTFALNWNKHDQTDQVTAVAGLTGSISASDLRTAINVEDGADVTDADNVKAAGAVMAFPHLADGDPIAIVAIGDSNMSGGNYTDASVAVSNASVKCWMLPTLTTGNGCYVSNRASIVWHSPDPNAPIRSAQNTDAYGGAGGSQPMCTMTGQLLGSTCPIDLMLAYELQALTGRDVYDYKNAMGQMQTDVWVNGSGAAWNGYTETFGAGNAGVTAALAAIPGGKTTVDIVILSLGANDIVIGGKSGQEWYDDRWSALYAQLVAQSWFDPLITQVFVVECSNNGYAGLAPYYAGWSGYALMCAYANERLRLVSSMGATLGADNLHYPPAQYQAFAQTIAKEAIAGPSFQTPIRANTFMRADAPVISGPATATGAFTLTSDMTPTGGTDTVYTFDTDNAFSGADRLLDINNNGNTVARFAGEGGFQLFDTSGNPQFQVGALGTTQFYQPITLNAGVTTISSAKTNAAGVYAFDYNTQALSNATAYMARWRNASADRITFKHDGTISTVGDLATTGGGNLVISGQSVLGGLVTTQVGTFSSTVAASGSAFSYSFDTAAPMGGGDSLVRFRNNGSTQWSLSYSGVVTSPGTFTSNTATTGSANGFVLNTAALTTGDKLTAFRNNGTDKLYVGYDGAIEAKAGTPGTTGTLILRPDSSLGTEQLDITSLVHGLTMKWTPSTGASTWTFTNMGADNSGTDFVFRSNTQQTAGNLMVLQNSSAGDLVKFNYLGAPAFWGATPATSRRSGGSGTPSTPGSAGTSLFQNTKWSGGTGASEYNMNDVVATLKDVGLLAA